MQTPNGLKLLQAAKNWVGLNAHQDNLASADVACADSVNTVYRVLFGVSIGGGSSTTELYHALEGSKSFTEVPSPLPGDIIISPTGYVHTHDGHGHVGIVGDNELIYSNNSNTGKWDAHLNDTLWAQMFDFVRYFRCTDVVGLPK